MLHTKQVRWALLDQALVSGTNFLVGILLVRFIGIEQYGIFVLAWMLVQFFASIQNALVISPMLVIAPKIPVEERSNYFSATVALQAVFVSLLAFLAVAAVFIPGQYKPNWLPLDATLPLVACMFFVQFQDYARRNLFARLSPHRSFYLDLVAYGAQLPLIFMVVRAYPTFETALFVIAGTMFCSVLLGCRWLAFAQVSKANIVEVATRHWFSAKWLLGSAIMQWLSGNYFLIVAGMLLGPAVVGAIRAAQNLLGLTHILFQGLENVVPREASRRYHAGGAYELLSYIIKVGLALLLGTGLVATASAVFAKPLLYFVYGALEPNSIIAMRWYVPIYILVAVGLSLRAGLRSLEKTRAIFFAYIIGTVFSLVVANYFVTQFGVSGVMAGMLIVQLTMVLVLITTLFLELRVKG